MGSLTRYRFGVFELDPETPELRKSDRRVRLRPQGLKLLRLLVSRPREVITREEIARVLWDAGVFVDFEQGLNHTIKQVRTALADDAESPRFIETLPRRGYRFIAPVEALLDPKEAPVSADGRLDLNPSPSLPQPGQWPALEWLERHRIGIAVSTCVVLSILGVGWWAMVRPPAASSAIPSVAVLPFNTIGGGGNYFADGLTEALTTELGRIRGLRVISSNTAVRVSRPARIA